MPTPTPLPTPTPTPSPKPSVAGYPANCPIDAPAELFVTRVSAVDDPVRAAWTGGQTDPADGAWAIGRVLTRLAGNANVPLYVASWLENFDSDDSFFRTAWATKDGAYDLTGSPMLLEAIVNRVDLRDPNVHSLGELRMIFGPPWKSAIQGSIIVEMVVPVSAQYDISSWAGAWHALGDPNLSSATYNTMLQQLTDYALNHVGTHYRIRTANESQVSNWTFRQFEPDLNGYLTPADLTFTPGHQFALLNAQEQNQLATISGGLRFPALVIDPNDEAALIAYGQSVKALIPTGLYHIPATYDGRSMAATSFTLLQLYRGEDDPFTAFRFDESWTIPGSGYANKCDLLSQYLQWVSRIDTASRAGHESCVGA